ncbi:ABC transporter permease [Naasia aerilata]|uniref:Transport permease protein n=1 Tax=Naasia aerilata TaxID=1162966 RepID=A0ABM8G7K7_9MICO|nr:ABC transporter permease [Naasia aerilata]BDZ44155.1 transport permease protein [Naasia aerilata]
MTVRQVTRIAAARGGLRVDWAELWAYRDLLYFLTWRDVKVRYKQTALGVAWAVLQPVAAMLVFSVFFGLLARLPSDGVPYPVFAYAALVPWTFFANAVIQGSNSLVDQEALLTKVYFPRLLAPTAAVLAGLIDVAIAAVVLIAMLLIYGIVPTLALLTIPLFLVLACVTALAVAIWLSALNVRFRDVRYTLPFLVQIWLFASPVVYPSSLVPAPWNLLYALNPMASVIDGFRWALLGTAEFPGLRLLVSLAVVALLLVGGLRYFRSVERSFADAI